MKKQIFLQSFNIERGTIICFLLLFVITLFSCNSSKSPESFANEYADLECQEYDLYIQLQKASSTDEKSILLDKLDAIDEKQEILHNEIFKLFDLEIGGEIFMAGDEAIKDCPFYEEYNSYFDEDNFYDSNEDENVGSIVLSDYFELINNDKSCFTKYNDTWEVVDYNLKFSLKNLSKFTITEVRIDPSMDIRFKDSEYKTNVILYDITNLENLGWQPYTDQEFSIKFSGNTTQGLSTDNFERTPKELTITLKIKAKSISVDYEEYFEEVKSFSVIDDWKNYQSELGLR